MQKRQYTFYGSVPPHLVSLIFFVSLPWRCPSYDCGGEGQVEGRLKPKTHYAAAAAAAAEPPKHRPGHRDAIFN